MAHDINLSVGYSLNVSVVVIISIHLMQPRSGTSSLEVNAGRGPSVGYERTLGASANHTARVEWLENFLPLRWNSFIPSSLRLTCGELFVESQCGDTVRVWREAEACFCVMDPPLHSLIVPGSS